MADHLLGMQKDNVPFCSCSSVFIRKASVGARAALSPAPTIFLDPSREGKAQDTRPRANTWQEPHPQSGNGSSAGSLGLMFPLCPDWPQPLQPSSFFMF